MKNVMIIVLLVVGSVALYYCFTLSQNLADQKQRTQLYSNKADSLAKELQKVRQEALDARDQAIRINEEIMREAEKIKNQKQNK